MASIIPIILGVSFAAGVFILHGFALSVLWSWFISPYFGIHEIGIAQAIGVSITVGLVTSQYNGKQDNKERALFTLFMPIFALAFGWIVVQFI